MPTPRAPKVSKAALREAYRKDLEAAWLYFRRRHPRHEPYAFVLYGAA
jgi:hypothetical protein